MHILEVKLPICANYSYHNEMIIRNITEELYLIASQYPVVIILGPRQAGKTTLAKQSFKQHHYCNLEHPLRLDN